MATVVRTSDPAYILLSFSLNYVTMYNSKWKRFITANSVTNLNKYNTFIAYLITLLQVHNQFIFQFLLQILYWKSAFLLSCEKEFVSRSI